ncbi:hypothetical protein LTR37_000468 [Vermiconidia calcicola]|uniref:Uncharacterized protein n=1 Tax=Vermiconidia calcicola TaxID=1690605 RepID=A0ACC3NZ23_9PEZI|nr:hypothetical protein LTR37_000468 [Vermiconidia calcicola]
MSANTVIFGGSGKVARHITRLLAAEGHNVYSMIRNAEQKSDIEGIGGKPVVQSIEDSSVDDMAKTIADLKASTVIWSAGAGGKGGLDRTQAVDKDGAIRSMDATAKAGVKRYIIVSAVDVRDKENKPEPDWYNDEDRDRSNKVRSALGFYMELTDNGRRGLEYTIVRPGGLSDDPAKGAIEAGKVHLNQVISREDVASVVIECMKQDATKGLAFDCVGGDTPVADAIAKVAKEKIDTFEGRY